jgi:hypothetical protein
MRLSKEQRLIKCFDGKKRVFSFAPMDVESAMDVEDELVRVAADVVSKAGPGIEEVFRERAKITADDLRALTNLPAGVLQAIPRDSLKWLSRKLLNGLVILDENEDPDGGTAVMVKDGWAEPYFKGRWPERIEVLIHAVDISFPGYFSNAQAFAAGLVERLGGIIPKGSKEGSATE